jgi:hypothetical protein
MFLFSSKIDDNHLLASLLKLCCWGFVCTLEWNRVNLSAIKYCKKRLTDYEVQMNEVACLLIWLGMGCRN